MPVTNPVPRVELSLTVPIVNTLAFLFTVVGEWWVEKKVISRGRWNPSLFLSSIPAWKLACLLTTPHPRDIGGHDTFYLRHCLVCT